MPTPSPPATGLAQGEFRRGWPVVLACFRMALLSWGFCPCGQGV